MIFEKISTERSFYFTGFSFEKIQGNDFIKINILDKATNTAFSIYKKQEDKLYNIVAELNEFENVDDRIYVVYKNGRLKFDFRTN